MNAPGEPHAEPIAIRAAGERARGATAYVTLEPCSHHGRTPPCVDVLLAAGVRRVVYAVGDPNPRVNGARREAAARRRREGANAGLLAKEAEDTQCRIPDAHARGRPFVRLKSAASLDGRTALANGESKWITSEEARADVQHWRAQSGAILTSAATVLADDPRLDVRIEAPRQPLRVVLDRRRRVRKTAQHSRAAGRGAAVRGGRRPEAANAGREETLGAARIERVRIRAQAPRPACACSRGWRELEINDVLVEAGPRLVRRVARRGPGRRMAAVPRAEVVGPAREAAGGASRDSRSWTAAPRFELLDSSTVGPDLRLRLRPAAASDRKRHRMFTGIVAGDRRRSARSSRAPARRAARRCAWRSLSRRIERERLSPRRQHQRATACASPSPALDADSFVADVSGETLRVTTLGAKQAGARVNLEPALRAGDSLGGHWVSGHVDGSPKSLARRDDARSLRVELAAPATLARYIARKGSVTLDGVSLTVNAVDGAKFSINLIPHTLEVTTLGALAPGVGSISKSTCWRATSSA